MKYKNRIYYCKKKWGNTPETREAFITRSKELAREAVKKGFKCKKLYKWMKNQETR